MNFKNPEGQTARWLEYLQTYDFDVCHRRGKSHINADSLSRRPCEGTCKHCNKEEKHDVQVSVTKIVQFELNGKELSFEGFRKAQFEDPSLKLIIEWKNSNYKPSFQEVSNMSPLVKAYLAQWDSLMVKESVLYRLWENANGREIKEKLVVPFALQIELIKQLHSTDYGGQLGVTKTLRKVKDRFYWVGCRENVEDYCRTCDVCNSRKGPSTRNQARMQQFNVGSPFERVAVDILGPLPVTERGNKFLIVLMDYFTKWPEVMPVPNQEAETIAEVLVDHVFSRFGVPMELHSDQGRNFESEVFRETMKIMGINKTKRHLFNFIANVVWS